MEKRRVEMEKVRVDMERAARGYLPLTCHVILATSHLQPCHLASMLPCCVTTCCVGTCYLLLAACYCHLLLAALLLVTCCLSTLLRVTRYLLPYYVLLATRHLPPCYVVARYRGGLLRVTRYLSTAALLLANRFLTRPPPPTSHSLLSPHSALFQPPNLTLH